MSLSSKRGGQFVLLASLCAATFALALDKVIFSVMLQPIKEEMALSDFQLGALGGFALAVFQALAGLPIARLADRWIRRDIITIGLFLWSLATAATGIARSFSQLFTARVAVGVGEAGCTPSSHSMIADAFPPERRAFAASVVTSGAYLGLIAGLWGGGYLVSEHGWRQALIFVGAPGMLLALLLRFTIKEPVRPASEISPSSGWIGLLRNRAFVHLCAIMSGASLSSWGILAWLPTFFIREFGKTPAQVGMWLGLGVGVASIAGVLGGGVVSTRLAKRTPTSALTFAAWTCALTAPLQTAAFLTNQFAGSLVLLVGSMVLSGVSLPVIYATMYDTTSTRERATAAAILGFFTLVVGQGLGPVFFGALSDIVRNWTGQEAIRPALLTGAILNIWPAIHLLRLRALTQGTHSEAST